MPTVGEKITALEAWRDTIDARLWGDGKTTSYDRSLEGRVAGMEQTLRGADALAEAARELRRSTSRTWSRWEKGGLFLFAAITAASALVAALAVILGG